MKIEAVRPVWILTLIASLVLTASSPAFSAEGNEQERRIEEGRKAEAKNEGVKKEETPLTRLEEATKVMTSDLDKNQAVQFAAIQNSYQTIAAVEDVKSSITRAVESCGKENPDIRDQMEMRFRTWKDNLRPVMKEARNRLDKMILLQDFSSPSVVRNYLKMFDDAVRYRNQGIVAVPVADKEQCLKLIKSMDDTEKNMIKLLIENLGLDAPLKVAE